MVMNVHIFTYIYIYVILFICLRRSVRISKLDTKTNVYIIGKKWPRKIRYWMTYPENNSIWYGHVRENRPNAITKNYD
jgi:hypothetical protein